MVTKETERNGFMVFWIVLFMIIALILFIYAIPLRVKICFKRENKHNFFSVRIGVLWGLVKFHLKEPEIFFNKNIFHPSVKVKAKVAKAVDRPKKVKEELGLKELQEAFRKIREYKYLIDEMTDDILAKATVRELKWSTSIGFADPAFTGLAYGLVWGGKSIIYNFIRQKVKKVSGQPQIFVHSDFAKNGFSTNISCIFALRLGHIITVAMKNMVSYIIKRG